MQVSLGLCWVGMRVSRNYCQRGSNSDAAFKFCFLFDEGREDRNTTKSGPSSAQASETPFKWRFAGGPMVAQH